MTLSIHRYLKKEFVCLGLINHYISRPDLPEDVCFAKFAVGTLMNFRVAKISDIQIKI